MPSAPSAVCPPAAEDTAPTEGAVTESDLSLALVVPTASDAAAKEAVSVMALVSEPVTAAKPLTADDKQKRLRTFFRSHHRTESADEEDMQAVCTALIENKCGPLCAGISAPF